MSARYNIRHVTHGYFLLTVIAFVIWVEKPNTYLIHLFGCHTTLYMFFLALLFGDLGVMTLGRICFILWPVYILAFLACYLLAAIKKNYKPLAMIAVIDVLCSCVIFLRYVQCASFAGVEEVASFVGMCLSLLTAIMLNQYKSDGAQSS